MLLIKSKSLEKYLTNCFIIVSLLFMLLLGLCSWYAKLPIVMIIMLEVALMFFCYGITKKIMMKTLATFERSILHLDAINQEDYNQRAKPVFPQGVVYDFNQQLKTLSDKLQKQKSTYDQHTFLIYQLIEQLDSPILVFNDKQQLIFANEAFYFLFKQPWQMFRHASSELLGLINKDKHWQFKDSSKNKQWQIKQSTFMDDSDTHELLVFIDVTQILRKNQLDAWQQIIRVLSHEIRNSLTPISSIAEILLDKVDNEKDKKALELVGERCQHLDDFVQRYSSISKPLQLNFQWLAIKQLEQHIQDLFKQSTIKFKSKIEKIWVDITFFQQVMINLIKNAFEAEANLVSIAIEILDKHYVIQITDNGHGFANLDNCFVPLYTTKAQGQGLGLSFCSNIIEQHQGSMTLDNNQQQGVTVRITLPIPSH